MQQPAMQPAAAEGPFASPTVWLDAADMITRDILNGKGETEAVAQAVATHRMTNAKDIRDLQELAAARAEAVAVANTKAPSSTKAHQTRLKLAGSDEA